MKKKNKKFLWFMYNFNNSMKYPTMSLFGKLI